MSQWDIDFFANPSLSSAEKAAWECYQGPRHEEIATLLYKGELSLIEKLKKEGVEEANIPAEIDFIRHNIQILDRSFRHISLIGSYSVFHGIGKKEYQEISKLQLGDIFQPSCFFSVTYSLPVAERYSRRMTGEFQIIGMRLKQGQKAIFLGHLPLCLDEIVLPRNSNFQLIDIRSIIINNPIPSTIGESIATRHRIKLYSLEWLNE